MAEEVQAVDATPTDSPPPSSEPPAADPSPTPEPTPDVTKTSEPANLGTAPVQDKPQVSPATWPEDWREQLAGDNADDLKTLSRWKDPSNIFKAFKGIRGKVSAGDLLPAKPADATDEKAMAEWRAAVGVPEKAEDYYKALPEDFEADEADKPFLDSYFARMHEKGVPPADVAEGVQVYYEEREKEVEARLEMDREQMNAAEDQLRMEMGPEFTPRMNHMRSTLFQTGLPDIGLPPAPEGLMHRFFGARMEDGTAFGNDPDSMSWLLGLAAAINPDIGHTVTPVAGQDQMTTIEDEIRQLETEAGDTKGKNSDYWANPNKQARLRELYDIQEKMQARGR
jgi:hypothetical protein